MGCHQFPTYKMYSPGLSVWRLSNSVYPGVSNNLRPPNLPEVDGSIIYCDVFIRTLSVANEKKKNEFKFTSSKKKKGKGKGRGGGGREGKERKRQEREIFFEIT